MSELKDPFTERLIKLGMQADKDMADAAIDKCNCMIRYGAGAPLPSIRKGKEFFTPEGHKVDDPLSFEDMQPSVIKKLMAERGEVYIGYMFEPSKRN